jgi:hypothetical protein
LQEAGDTSCADYWPRLFQLRSRRGHLSFLWAAAATRDLEEVPQNLGRELQRPPRRLLIDMGCVRSYGLKDTDRVLVVLGPSSGTRSSAMYASLRHAHEQTSTRRPSSHSVSLTSE